MSVREAPGIFKPIFSIFSWTEISLFWHLKVSVQNVALVCPGTEVPGGCARSFPGLKMSV